MKRLSIIFIFIFSACGADPIEPCDCSVIKDCFEQTEEVFFETYYKDCVDICSTCEKWAANCKYIYDVAFCVTDRWDRGYSNSACLVDKEKIDEMHIQSECNSTHNWLCLSFQE